MKQGDIWLADLNPSIGREQAGQRPIVIISGDLVNTYLEIVIACPLTSQIKKYKGNLVLIPDSTNGLSHSSEVLTFHIRSISKNRLVKRLGSISDEQIGIIKNTLIDILTL